MSIERPDVTVKVSKELLGELGDWSEPVQVRIEQLGNGEYDMIARRHDCPARAADDERLSA